MASIKSDQLPLPMIPETVEFIQTITVDINGIARGKMYPREKLEDLLQNKEEIVCLTELSGTNCEIPTSIKELADNHYTNNYIVPDKSTLTIAPWSKDSSLAMVFYDAYDIGSKTPFPFNPRLLAKNMIKELEKMGLKLFIGVENEFRLFDKIKEKPLLNKNRFGDQFLQSTFFLPYFKQLKNQLKTINIEYDSCNLEYGESQVEIPLKIYAGIEGVDKVWLFRQLSKHVANDMGMIASYMTVPLYNGVASGMHTNHSLWKETDQGLRNLMWTPSGNSELSELGKSWLAGIIKHGRALSAFFLPTVNCYRRVRAAAWAPDQISWNYTDRMVAMRVKTSRDNEKANYIENRLPSSACNIYLSISAMIAAGLDGIRNKLELNNPGNGSHCENLPRSLQEALNALKEDKLLSNSLGEQFVDWYIKAKEDTDVEPLKDVDIDDRSEQGIAKEIDKYFDL